MRFGSFGRAFPIGNGRFVLIIPNDTRLRPIGFALQARSTCSRLPLRDVYGVASMRCEEGYLCDVCGGDVEEITDSDLYLRYVIGMVDPETLHTTRERHVRCNPALTQI